MKLYYHPNSTYSRRVRILGVEKAISFDEEVVAMEKLAHRKKDYLAVNAYGRVPVLEDGDLRLCESNVILEYLEETHPEPGLMPADPASRARVRRHMHLCDLEFARHVSTIVFPKRFLPEDRWNRDDMQAAAKSIKRHFKILTEELADRPFLHGDAFSLADVSYMPFLHFHAILDVDVPANIQAWAGRLSERKSAQETVPER